MRAARTTKIEDFRNRFEIAVGREERETNLRYDCPDTYDRPIRKAESLVVPAVAVHSRAFRGQRHCTPLCVL